RTHPKPLELPRKTPPAALHPAAAASAHPAPSAAPAPALIATAPAPVRARRRVATWVVAGLSGALLVGAVGAGVFAQLKYGALTDRCPMNACDPTSYPNAQADRDAGRAAAIATDVLWPLGVAAAGVALALFF